MVTVVVGESEDLLQDQVDTLDYVAILFEIGEEGGHCLKLTPIEM